MLLFPAIFTIIGYFKLIQLFLIDFKSIKNNSLDESSKNIFKKMLYYILFIFICFKFFFLLLIIDKIFDGIIIDFLSAIIMCFFIFLNFFTPISKFLIKQNFYAKISNFTFTQIESDLSELSEEERKEYLADLNVTESGLQKVIKATYKLLNLSTFFTVGADECRAWTFKNNMSAPECAGVIHTDFQKGFICAEVYPYEAIHELGSEAKVKEAGKIRTEGKGYYPKDGDIMFFRFNVNKKA